MLKKQADLYEDTKWLKFLRAPPIYFKLLENPKITQLSKVAKVNVGIITYANAFFILSKEQLKKRGIEKRYLKPVLTSPKDLLFFDVAANDAKKHIFYVNEPRQKLKSTRALEYIKWGETTPVEITRGAEKGKIVEGFQNTPSLRSRSREMWYSIGGREPSPILVPRLIWERTFVAWNKAGAYSNDRFYEITPNRISDLMVLLGILNSSMSAMITEVSGRTTLGEGGLELMKYELDKMPILDPNKLRETERKKIEKVFRYLCEARRRHKVEAESEARDNLDALIFSFLGLSKTEQQQIFGAFEELRAMRKERVEVEVLIEHPETKKRVARTKKLREFMPKEEPLTRWTR